MIAPNAHGHCSAYMIVHGHEEELLHIERLFVQIEVHPLLHIAAAQLCQLCRLCDPCTERLFARHVFLAKLLPQQCDFRC